MSHSRCDSEETISEMPVTLPVTLELAQNFVNTPGAWDSYRAEMRPLVSKHAGDRADDFFSDVQRVAQNAVALVKKYTAHRSAVDGYREAMEAAACKYKSALETMTQEWVEAVKNQTELVNATKRSYFCRPNEADKALFQQRVFDLDAMLQDRAGLEDRVKATDKGKVYIGMLEYMETHADPDIWKDQKDDLRQKLKALVDEQATQLREQREVYMRHLNGDPVATTLTHMLLNDLEPSSKKRVADEMLSKRGRKPPPVKQAVVPITVDVAKQMAKVRRDGTGRKHPIPRLCTCTMCYPTNVHGASDQFNYSWSVVDKNGFFDPTNPNFFGVWEVFSNPYGKGDGIPFGPQQAFEAAKCSVLDIYRYEDPDAEQHNHFIFVPREISCTDENDTRFIPQDIFPGFVYSGVSQGKRYQHANKRICGGKRSYLQLFGKAGYRGSKPRGYVDGMPVWNQLLYKRPE